MRRGFTLVELAAVAVCGAALAAFGAAGMGQPRARSKQMKDADQQRNIVMSFVIFSQGNREEYPLPSKLDGGNTTVTETGRAKDTTANILSVLIFNAYITPETVVSPAENNKKIKIHKGYETALPKTAVKADSASWDPSLKADFTSETGGHVSYAHLQPAGRRLSRWANTINAEEAVVCTRGPEMTAAAIDGEAATPSYANEKSNTFAFFKSLQKKEGTWWSGNVAFNDCHVDFIADYLSPGQSVLTGARYKNKAGQAVPDMAFLDEPNDPEAANNFLGIFTKAGAVPSDYKAIWD